MAAACGSTDGQQTQQERSQSPQNVFELASSNMLEVETLRFEMKIGGSGLYEVTGTGFQDVAEGNMAATLQMRSPAPAMAVQAGLYEMLLVDDVLYIRGPFSTESLPPGKSWIKWDLAQWGAELEELFNLESSVEKWRDNNPLAQMERLQSLDGETEELGSDLIRGVPTTHYRYTVDTAEVIEYLDFEGLDVDTLREQLGDQQTPIELWIDRDNLIRRMRYSADKPDPESGHSITLTFENDFFDFGAEQEVTAPADAEVVDATEGIFGSGP